MSKLLPVILKFDDLLSYDNIEEITQGYTPFHYRGYVWKPSEIFLEVKFSEKPVELLKCAILGHMFDKVVLDYGEGKSAEFSYVIIQSNDRYTVRMLALRMKIFISEQEKKEFDLMGLINSGQIFIGDKNE